MDYFEKKRIAELVGDLWWEKDRMSSSGVETLEDLTQIIENL